MRPEDFTYLIVTLCYFHPFAIDFQILGMLMITILYQNSINHVKLKVLVACCFVDKFEHTNEIGVSLI